MRIVYNSFGGRFSDNPRVLYDALRASGDHEHVWLVEPGHEESFPAGIGKVETGSPECVAALESCDLLVANTHTEVEWEKRPETAYLQTWHGTPLKRIHWDVLWAPEGRLERLSRDVARWDLLISPNAASTPRLRGAFRYDGEILEVGYPRNDVLLAPDRDEVRARVRERLRIPDGATAVLYTPTWRDSFVFDESEPEYALPLDVEHLFDVLGGNHCLMLRLHYMLTGRLAALDHPGVRDVSFEPDVAELYLAADVLVTDYSSTMFDFAVTGRPVVFYAYDLEDYRDAQRGFYFDFVPDAPGPVTRTTTELAEAVRDVDGWRERYAARYARFRQTFCHREDGHATDRVLAAISSRQRRAGPQRPARDPARR